MMYDPMNMVLSQWFNIEEPKVVMCCRCGGQEGEWLEDGWMPCYHCLTRGTCECREEVDQ